MSSSKEGARRSWESWSTSEQDIFYSALGEIGKNFEDISKRLQTKSYDQVRYLYYRIVRKVENLIKPSSIDKRNKPEELNAVLSYWDIKKQFSLQQGLSNTTGQKGENDRFIQALKARIKTRKELLILLTSKEKNKDISSISNSVKKRTFTEMNTSNVEHSQPSKNTYSSDVETPPSTFVLTPPSNPSNPSTPIDSQTTSTGKLVCQFIPREKVTRNLLASSNFNPKLQLTLKGTKSLSYIMDYLLEKWETAFKKYGIDAKNRSELNISLFLHSFEWKRTDCPSFPISTLAKDSNILQFDYSICSPKLPSVDSSQINSPTPQSIYSSPDHHLSTLPSSTNTIYSVSPSIIPPSNSLATSLSTSTTTTIPLLNNNSNGSLLDFPDIPILPNANSNSSHSLSTVSSTTVLPNPLAFLNLTSSNNNPVSSQNSSPSNTKMNIHNMLVNSEITNSSMTLNAMIGDASCDGFGNSYKKDEVELKSFHRNLFDSNLSQDSADKHNKTLNTSKLSFLGIISRKQ